MKQVVCIAGIILLLVACRKDASNDDSSLNKLAGRYNGTFHRSGMDTVAVNFLFKTDNTFEASGERLNYPALCNGSFAKNGDNLIINDTCTWTANFDWSLIFDGNYTINFTDENSVRIWRTNGAVMDEYLLKRFVR